MDRRVDITDVTTPQGVMFSYSVEWYEETNLNIKWKLKHQPSSSEIYF
jgi:hypothetical protein